MSDTPRTDALFDGVASRMETYEFCCEMERKYDALYEQAIKRAISIACEQSKQKRAGEALGAAMLKTADLECQLHNAQANLKALADNARYNTLALTNKLQEKTDEVIKLNTELERVRLVCESRRSAWHYAVCERDEARNELRCVKDKLEVCRNTLHNVAGERNDTRGKLREQADEIKMLRAQLDQLAASGNSREREWDTLVEEYRKELASYKERVQRAEQEAQEEQGALPVVEGVDFIANERELQREMWGDEHDDQHTNGELARAGALMALYHKSGRTTAPHGWPWAEEEWPKNAPVDMLIKAGALIASELDRLQREAEAANKQEESAPVYCSCDASIERPMSLYIGTISFQNRKEGEA